MRFDAFKQSYGWMGRCLLGGLAAVLLPMAAVPAEDQPEGAYPKIVDTKPARGATEVDPESNRILVTFDRDMSGGMSWTGAKSLLPPIDSTRKAKWIDARTCELPVNLEPGKAYRVGINSKAYRNFKSAKGVAAIEDQLAFATRGASAEDKASVRTPKVVSIVPDFNAEKVQPGPSKLTVTFDIPMESGMSWTHGSGGFPKMPDNQKPQWSDDQKTCVLPVILEPNQNYKLGLNGYGYHNFRGRNGLALPPMHYHFQTGDAR